MLSIRIPLFVSFVVAVVLAQAHGGDVRHTCMSRRGGRTAPNTGPDGEHPRLSLPPARLPSGTRTITSTSTSRRTLQKPSSLKTLLKLRGGGGRGRGTRTAAKKGAVDPSISLVGSAAKELTSTIWLVSKHLASQHIVPVVKDSQDKVVVSLKRFVQEAFELIDEGGKGEPTSTQTKPAFFLPRFQSNGANEDNNNSKSSTPSSSLLSSSASPSSRTTKTAAAALVAPSSLSSALMALVRPHRLLKLSLTALLLAEALDALGILTEDTPLALQSQFRRIWHFGVKPKVLHWQARTHKLWKHLKQQIPKYPVKYHFAIGTSLGMALSPALSTVAKVWGPPTLILYGLSELLNYVVQTASFHNPFLRFVERFLDTIRRRVRLCVPAPPPLSPSTSIFVSPQGRVLQTSGGGDGGRTKRRRRQRQRLPIRQANNNYSLGISGMIGLGSATNTEKTEGLPLIARMLGILKESKQALGNFREQTAAAMARARMESSSSFETTVNEESLTLVGEMIRHGFVVGSMVGMIAGV